MKQFLFKSRDKLVLNYLVDVISHLEVRSLSDGSLIQKIELPPGAIYETWEKKSHYEQFYMLESFLSPGVIYRLDLRSTPFKPEILKESKVPGFDATKFVTNQVFYPSYDGTVIPMFIVHNRNVVRDGNAITLLTAYGGYEISFLPSFELDILVLLQNFDGIYAVANIRGGG